MILTHISNIKYLSESVHQASLIIESANKKRWFISDAIRCPIYHELNHLSPVLFFVVARNVPKKGYKNPQG